MQIKIVHRNRRPGFTCLALCIIYVHNPENNGGVSCNEIRLCTSEHGRPSVAAQVAQLAQAGSDKVFKEVASGAKTERAQLHRLLKALDEGDVLLVTRLDRLARSTRDLLIPSPLSRRSRPGSVPS